MLNQLERHAPLLESAFHDDAIALHYSFSSTFASIVELLQEDTMRKKRW